MTNQELWQKVLAEIELNISKANFSTWFRDTEILSSRDGTVEISVPNSFTKEWLENKHIQSIFKILKVHAPDIKEINFLIQPKQNILQKTIKNIKQKVASKEQLNFPDLETNRETGLNPKYTFDSFIVGSFNELAHAAALSVCQNPGRVYNPFLVYGGVGLGKTHLLQAVGNELNKTYKNFGIKYLQCERFTNELVLSIQHKRMSEFKEKYRGLDLLIIDDIQFIAGKEKTQEEFFHVFNNLYELNKQIILSSDRPPKAISMLEERLRSRFEGGMISDIGIPDFETRVAILKEKVRIKNILLSDEIINFIAANIQNNVRELEGALNKITASPLLNDGEDIKLSQEELKKELKHILIKPKCLTTPKKIFQVVSDFYEVDEKTLLNQNRRREVVKPRQIIMYLLRNELNWSFPSIGERLGGKDHTTVIHAFHKINDELKINDSLQEELALIRQRVYNA